MTKLEKLNSSSGPEAIELTKSCDQLNKKIEKLEEEWMGISENLESLQTDLQKITS